MMLWNDKPYHSLDYELKKRFGEKVYRLSLNGGMTCPNRDGTIGTGGCIFCSAGGSGDFAADPSLSVREQIRQARERLKKKRPASRFIAYFQAYTNTYAPVEQLETLYTQALSSSEIAGISIATRPDALPCEVLILLTRLKAAFPDKFIWIELGLQTIHEKTASYIRRGYSLPCFTEAVSALKQRGFPIIVHIILGLPGETDIQMYETIELLNTLPVSGIKLQLLHVLKGTDLAADYETGAFQTLTMEHYTDLVIHCLEQLRPDIVIHRLTGDGPENLLIAPKWSLQKRRVLNHIHHTMHTQNTWQGKHCQIS